LLDVSGRVATWNEGAERIKGYAIHEILGEHFSRFYPDEAVRNGWPDKELRMAAEAGTDYSGVLCGRATWKEGIPVYAKQGAKALEEWMSVEGVKNIDAVNEAIKPATPWFKKFGLSSM